MIITPAHTILLIVMFPSAVQSKFFTCMIFITVDNTIKSQEPRVKSLWPQVPHWASVMLWPATVGLWPVGMSLRPAAAMLWPVGNWRTGRPGRKLPSHQQ